MKPSPTTTPRQLLGIHHTAILGSMALISALCWIYLILLSSDMDGASAAALSERALTTQIGPWSAAQFTLMFIMWWVMMIGMMFPSAAPMILMFARIHAGNRDRGAPFVPTVVFTSAYALTWGAFSGLATGGQWWLEQQSLINSMMEARAPSLGGGLFAAAGVYQLTPLKSACLHHCRSPLAFVIGQWRDGTWGALVMGVRHGTYCLGCCAFLMLLLFVGGVMNLLWVAAIALLVLTEKVLPHGHWVARGSGILMIGVGIHLALV